MPTVLHRIWPVEMAFTCSADQRIAPMLKCGLKTWQVIRIVYLICRSSLKQDITREANILLPLLEDMKQQGDMLHDC
jgi:hypothetical protein